MSRVASLLDESLSHLAAFWPVTLVLLVAAILALASLQRSGQIGSDQLRLLLVVSGVVLVAVPLFAVLFEAESPGHRVAGGLGSVLVGTTALLYVGAVAFALVQAKGHRLALAAVALLFGWVNLGCIAVASMAVTGDWP